MFGRRAARRAWSVPLTIGFAAFRDPDHGHDEPIIVNFVNGVLAVACARNIRLLE